MAIENIKLRDVDATEYLKDIEVSRAYELRPGAVYALKVDAILTSEVAGMVAELVSEWQAATGCKFIVLEKHFDLVEPPERKPDPTMCGNGPPIEC